MLRRTIDNDRGGSLARKLKELRPEIAPSAYRSNGSFAHAGSSSVKRTRDMITEIGELFTFWLYAIGAG